MVARGEIEFLISAVAQSNGVLGQAPQSSEPEIFLVVTWAIVLCAIIGPLSVGLLVRRVRRLESRYSSLAGRGNDASTRDVLGVWSVH